MAQKVDTIVLAFDIERSGGGANHHTIGIGACVLDNNFTELGRLFLNGHTTNTVFEPRCYEEFWSKNLDKLNILKYEGPLHHNDRQKEMIREFQEFRAKWEKYASDNNLKLELVSDNKVYDGGFINNMIEIINGGREFYEENDKFFSSTTRSEILPIPYTALSHALADGKIGQKYSTFYETHSQQRGLLMAVDPSFRGNWGFTKRIAELYDVPSMTHAHDHNPANDAYAIAYDAVVMMNIRDGIIKRR